MSERLLALDLSTSTGWALLQRQEPQPVLLGYGIVAEGPSVKDYPWSYLERTERLAERIQQLVDAHKPDRILIEETNRSKNRYSQKMLEFIHRAVLDCLVGRGIPVHYINTSAWFSTLNLRLTDMDRKKNSLLSKARRSGESLDKKALGIRGRITRKHLSIRFVKDTYGIDLQVQEDDIADAICQGVAYYRGAPLCDGT